MSINIMSKEFYIQKLLPILITSLLSAGIALLQAMLQQYSTDIKPVANAYEAGALGFVLKSAYFIVRRA